MHPDLLHIGSFALPTYGFLLAIGFLLALGLLRKRAPSFGISPDTASDLGLWILLAGLVGSKVLLVVVEWPYYVSSFSNFKELARVAGVFYGGLIGATLAAAVLIRKKGVSFFAFTDAAAPAVLVGQSIGRLGCFAAGCCWGAPTAVPWAVTFTSEAAHKNVGVPLGVAIHPTQLYESAATLLLAGLLVAFEKRKWSGQTFARYVGGYALLRGTIEFFRGDPRGSVADGLVSTSQLIALAGIVLAFGLWYTRRHRPPEPQPA